MQHQTSYDENGPLTALGEVEFSANTGLPGGPQKFSVPTFMVFSDTSEVVVEYNGLRLSEFGGRNDHYGFGTSPETALRDAQERIEKLHGCNADIRIITRLSRRPCTPSDEAPFYGGSQRICYIPRNWHCEHPSVVDQEQEEEFVVWENGAPTEDAKRFFDIVSELCSKDAAPNRKGGLHSIISRSQPATRESFMAFFDQDLQNAS